VARPADADQVAELLAGPGPLLARGLGRSYGDAAQVGGGTVLDTAGLDAFDLDPGTGVLRAGAGVSLARILAEGVPQGWFVPVSPGTAQVSLGGAVAADVHGKNHHAVGAFCSHLEGLTLATPRGPVETGPERDPELFWATAGGMGLTGVVTEATVRLTPVESAWMLVDTERVPDLDHLMAALEAGDARAPYTVAWLDNLARGRHLGRGVVSVGRHAPADALGGRDRFGPAPKPAGLRVPLTPPGGLLRPLTVAAFNEAWFRKAPRRRTDELVGYPAFFHPLDGVGAWNRLYGPRGFVQYQFVVDAARADLVRRVLEVLAEARAPSFLAVLKRFGPADPGPLSFPAPGWTLALDLPAATPGLAPLLDGLDEAVAEAGGRVYLAKDGRLRPELLAVMYPRLGEFEAVCRRVDPDGVLTSDLARRLSIGGRR
jgi:decaprenylphospho-beta-D-ribofuranose 2-oxidase